MNFRTFALFLMFVTFSPLQLEICANDPIDLAGDWVVKLDPNNIGEEENWQGGFSGTAIKLPGICTEAGLGKALNVDWTQKAKVFRHLHQRRSYIGAAWYQRDFHLPEKFNESDARLILERVLWKSKVWVNGILIGSRSSLSTAHLFATGNALRPGVNRIVVCVDNREQVPMGRLSHAYTEHTQTIWNGVLGRMQIESMPSVLIKRLSVSPTPIDGAVSLHLEVHNRTKAERKLPMVFGIRHQGESKEEFRSEITKVFPIGIHAFDLKISVKGLKLWSEFTPNLYEVSCELSDQQVNVMTGFRAVDTSNAKININNQQSFMRGTLDCCIFPKTGYPPTDVGSWLRRFQIAKSYGLNHVRFHSWCPPEAAFTAADQLGLYLQIELPNWTAKMGEDEKVAQFLQAEGNRILDCYAHHPSFVFFSLGNELDGDLEFMDQLLLDFQMKANHILMTSTSFSFSKRGSEPGPLDQFFVTQRTASGWVRGQGEFNRSRPETKGDFRNGVAEVSRPLISHEIGQYSVFPNLAETEAYDGNLRSLAMESIRADLKLKKRLGDASLATENSGRLALTLYKEEIERAIRTPGQDGFQLLGLTDFSGQSTATVGLLDVFWNSKGLTTPEQFRKFCGPVVPLLRLEKRCFQSSETLAAKVQVGNFGPRSAQATDWEVTIKRESETLLRTHFHDVEIAIGNAIDVGEIEFPLNEILQPSRLEVSVHCRDLAIGNHWSIWVYPNEDQSSQSVEVFRRVNTKMLAALKRGRNVLLLPKRETIKHPIDGRFVPVFWSPLHFPDQSPTHGTIIRNVHSLFENFPTDSHTDWQWWELLAKSTSVDTSSISEGRSLPIMRFIDKFNRNALPAILWEAKVGDGKLFVCSLDITSQLNERPVAKALRNSIFAYMNRAAFDPADELTDSQLETLFD